MTNYYSKYLKYKKKYLMAKSNMWGGMESHHVEQGSAEELPSDAPP